MIEQKWQKTSKEEIVLKLGTDVDPNVLAVMDSKIAINFVQPWILDSGDSYHVCDTYMA